MGFLDRLRAWFHRKKDKPIPKIVVKPVVKKPVQQFSSKPPVINLEASSKVDQKKILEVKTEPTIIAPLKIEPEAKSEIQILKDEYDTLFKQKDSIRQEMVDLDRKLGAGELTDQQRDRLYKEKMVRVVGLVQRIFEIKSRSAELGKPIN